MLASLKLLNNYVKVDDQDAAELAEKITRVGLEVEDLKELAYATQLVVGYVEECVEHPDSDHLHVCQVRIGDDEVQQVVCGAPNVAAGQKVMVALPGCELRGGKITKSKIRGVESNGMICSVAELGIDQRLLRPEDKDGIAVLPADAPIGADALDVLGLRDYILDISLTPNRSDCMAIQSLAYEVGAVLGRKVTLPEVKKYDELPSDLTVDVETPLCPFFGIKLVKGVVTKESPEWLRNYLMASGVKPINNVVDISNFVMIETGQPIHMYDYDKMKKKGFVIKTGFDVTTTLLDGIEYQILPTDLIVSTDDGIGCVAGVMGGNDTKIDENSVNICIEAATFDAPTLRATARRMNDLTDASQHFIKGAVDTASSLRVLDRCADLLVQLADAKEVYETVSTPLDIPEKVVEVSVERVNGLLGTSLDAAAISEVFDALAFTYKIDDDVFKVTVPTYRNDITMAADLIEEVARVYGYDNLPSTLPFMEATHGVLTEKQFKEKVIRDTLVDLGLHEVLTYTLTSEDCVNDFNLFHPFDHTVKMMSPLSEERSVVRKSLIPSLLQTIKYNQDHANKDVCIFEISNSYSDNELSLLAIAGTGAYKSVPWIGHREMVDFYLMKGFVEVLAKKFNIEPNRYTLERVEKDNKDFHPGKSAYIIINGKKMGVIGQLHPLKAKKYGVKNTYVAELNLTDLLTVRTKKLTFAPIPQYPSVSRDLALVVDADVPARDIERVISRASKSLVKAMTIFDVYEGEHIEKGKKSVAISLQFQDLKRTLDDKTINDVTERILDELDKQLHATLRS
ncbi:MAG: phenylalanine--tRNA ligase subunit beta [Erysipelotrichaceae bacterium]|nr:phenylalanine--tRNA ligase subunit beta [Erysipelotrichaceae bacterium]